MKLTQFPDRKIIVEDEKYLYFGGTAYLGLPTNKDFQKVIQKNIKKWGTAYGSSREANIQLTAYENGEKALANFIQAEAALTISSGMLAGKLVIEQLETETDVFYHFPNLHPAISAINSLPFYVNGEMNPRLLDKTKENIVLLTDSVSNSNVECVDLSAITKIAPSKNITILIDESHSLGIIGENGCGFYSTINYPNLDRKIMISSLGKALGLTGGVIAGSAVFIENIKKLSSYVAAAGMNAAFVQSFADGLQIVHVQHKKLLKNLYYLEKLLQNNIHILFDKKYPVLYPLQPSIYNYLLENKVVIVNFKYPTPSGELNRIIITANHKKKDLERLVDVLNEYNS